MKKTKNSIVHGVNGGFIAVNEENIDRQLFEEYEKEVQKIAEIIKGEMEQLDESETPMDGREWCEENDIPENVFADAIDWNYNWFDYGVSPMHPWSTDEYE